jgi:SNF2 family DNA or RNA helicase
MEKTILLCEEIHNEQQKILKKLEKLSQPPNIINCTMKSYQVKLFINFFIKVTGLRWISSCFELNHSCILADDMGLGKTLQSIVFLNFNQFFSLS